MTDNKTVLTTSCDAYQKYNLHYGKNKKENLILPTLSQRRSKLRPVLLLNAVLCLCTIKHKRLPEFILHLEE